jgi:cytoskeletal protein CcmA (bactofilin family)
MWHRDEPVEVKTVHANLRPAERSSIACIGKGILIKGDVTGSEDLVVDGRVEGRIELRDHHVTIGVGAGISADVMARMVTVRGTITGNVIASHKVEIRETGSVHGDIHAPRLAMSDGAVLSGRVDTRQNQVAQAEPDPVPVSFQDSIGTLSPAFVASRDEPALVGAGTDIWAH